MKYSAQQIRKVIFMGIRIVTSLCCKQMYLNNLNIASIYDSNNEVRHMQCKFRFINMESMMGRCIFHLLFDIQMYLDTIDIV